MKMNSKIDLLIPAHDPNFPSIYRLMRHAFNLLSLFCLLFSQSAQASVDRLTALGGLSQAILDDSNGFIFPATISEWPRFEVELFDDWAGVAYPISAQHTLGLFFNRKTSDLDNFTAYIQQNGSDVFRAMSPSPWFDLAYGYAPNNEFAIGASTSFAYDRSAIASQQASASSTNFHLGMRIGSEPTLDIGLGILLRRMQDHSLEGTTFKQSDGTGLALDIRYRRPLSTKVTWLPYFGISRDAYALYPDERTQTSLRLGSGLQLQPARGVLVIAAVDGLYERAEQSQNTQSSTRQSKLQLPTWILGGEAQVGSMLFRVGVRQENRLFEQELLQSNQQVKIQSFTTTFTTTLGLGIEFSNLLLDGLLEHDFLRDGPHLIGGSRHGGGILSHLSLTYRFNPASK